MSSELQIDAVVIPETDLSWMAVRSSGPGGQNVNKVSTKVRLRFDLPGCRVLSDAVKQRLYRLARKRLDGDGFLVISSQRTRTLLLNLADARAKLAKLIAEALPEPTPRHATKPTRAARRRRVNDKRVQADKKRARRPGGGEW